MATNGKTPANGATKLTIKQAAAYLGNLSPVQLRQQMKRFDKIFTADRIEIRPIEGTDYKVTYVYQSDLDALKTAMNTAPVKRGRQANGTRKYIARLTADQYTEAKNRLGDMADLLTPTFKVDDNGNPVKSTRAKRSKDAASTPQVDTTIPSAQVDINDLFGDTPVSSDVEIVQG